MAIRSGQPASNYEVGQRTEGEDVQADPVRFCPPHSLWSLERLGLSPVDVDVLLVRRSLIPVKLGSLRIVQKVGHSCTRSCRTGSTAEAAGGLPISDQDTYPSIGPPAHPNRCRRQSAMHNAVAMGIEQRLCDLAHDRQLVGSRNCARLLGEPEVEPMVSLIVRVDQPNAEFVIDNVARAEEPIVRKP